MAMPQRDNLIDEIWKTDLLLEYAVMHGSAMCCRGCMEKWWKVPRGRSLSAAQQRKAVDFLMAWIARQYDGVQVGKL